MSSEQSDLSLENLQNMCDNKGFKNKFYKELTVFYESVSSSLKKPWTRNRLQEVIECIKQSRVALGAGVRRTPMQYYWSTKYDVLKIDNEDCLILKKKKPEEPSIRVVAVEDYFDILFKIHEENGHSGRDKIKKIIKDKYYIPRKPVEIFVYLCPTCDNKRGFLKKSVISSSKAIVSEGLNSRGHVDVIDFVSAQDGEYKYLLSYQDKVTKFIQLRPLVTKQPLEIAMELVKIFGIFGAPLVLQSDNSREFTANIVKEVVKLWPVCKILHGSPEPTTSNIKTNEDIKYAIYNWMRENYSTKWSIGCYFVQYDRNASTDVTLGTSPYRTLFRRDPKIGLRSLNIPEDILKLVDSEEELAISVQIKMNSKSYKYCGVPRCTNTSIKTPNKLFVYVPNNKSIRLKWFKLARRNPIGISTNSPIYFCEDHFDLPNDMENYMQYHVMGSVSQVRMNPGCVPHKFTCQATEKPGTTERPYLSKRQKIKEECKKKSEEKSVATQHRPTTQQSTSDEITCGRSGMKPKVYRCCAVPLCHSTSIKTPNKLFVFVPQKKIIRDKWLRLARRDPTGILLSTQLYFCEDHFDLPNDMANYMEYHLMGSVSQIRMNPGCMPRKFSCQQDRQKRTCNATARPCYLKRQRKKMIEECVYDLDERSLKKEQMEHGDISPDEATSSLQAPDDTASSWQWEETDAVNLQPVKMTSYKTCAVPMCRSTTIKSPEKLFITVSKCPKLRKRWFQLAHRDSMFSSLKSSMFFCEDHFDLPNDMENYIQYKLMGSVGRIKLKPNCEPSKFQCQPDRIKRKAPRHQKTPNKRQRMNIIMQQILSEGNHEPAKSDMTGYSAEQSQASGTGPPVEENFCDACNTGFTGFLYLCGQCDYQMCTSCDYAGAHKDHYVLRVPAHSPKAEVDEVLGKFRATLDAMTLKRPPPNRRKKKKRKELAPAPAPGSETEDADEGDARATETPVDVVVKMEVEVEEHDPLGAARVKREPAAPEAPAAADSFTEMEEVTIKMEPIDEVECPSTSQFPSIHLGDPRAPNDHCESTDPRAPNDPCESTDPSDVQKVPTASGPLKRGMKQTSAPNISKKPRGKKSKAVT